MSLRPLVGLRAPALALSLVVGLGMLPRQSRARIVQDPQSAEGAGEAAAGDANDPKTRAKALADEGRKHYWAGEHQAAIKSFEEAHGLVADPNLLYNISAAYEKLGDYDRALEYLGRYERDAPADERPALDAKRRELEQAQARAQTERERQEQADKEPPKAPAGADGEDPVASPTASHDTAPPKTEDPLLGGLGWTLVGVGVAGLGVGTGFGIASLSRSVAGDENCTDASLCPAGVKDDLRVARRNATVADIGFGVALLATAAVVAIVGVRARKRAKSDSPTMSLRPGGLALEF